MSDETKKNWGRFLENTFQFFNRLIVEKGVFFRLHTRLCLFHHRAHVYHFSSFISLLDAFDITDPNGVQDAFHIMKLILSLFTLVSLCGKRSERKIRKSMNGFLVKNPNFLFLSTYSLFQSQTPSSTYC